ncbi:MAG: ABC transporter ATP-binding protein [Bacillota bacterium]
MELARYSEKEIGQELPDENITIRVNGLRKCYKLWNKPVDRLKEQLFSWTGKTYSRDFWVLNHISFNIQKGEVIGLLGRNGSGKSTLLQIITGVLRPTQGEIEVKGRIAALLELGSGFNPEFTGKENVYLNGAILGISHKEMEQYYEDIITFADIGDYINQPVKYYSSGMMVRLAFAVQACIYPDVLIVDEALAVGDISFQRKCFRRIEELRDRSTTILFVSHDINTITNICTRAILLENGEIVSDGSPAEICDLYQKKIFGESGNAPVKEYGDGSALFQEIWFEDSDGKKTTNIKSDSIGYFCYRIKFLKDIDNPVFGMRIVTTSGMAVFSTNTHTLGMRTGSYKEGEETTVKWELNLPLCPNSYFFSCGCSYYESDRFLCRAVDAAKLIVTGPVIGSGIVNAVTKVMIRGE